LSLPKQQNAAETEHTEEELSDSFHFHGCFFNQEELTEMTTIFNRKKGTDDKMSFSDVQSFLKVYWKWMERNKYHEGQDFPTETLSEIKKKLLSGTERVSFEQFLEIFFLFDCRTPEDVCPHGEKPRVHRATEELHKCITEDSFQEETFEKIFGKMDTDSDGRLSCKEVELFFYLYCVELSCA